MGATSGAGTVYPSGAPEFTPFFSGVCVTRSLVLSVCFVDRCLSFCTFSFDHCVVYSSSIYRFWLPLWYLQTLLVLLYFFFWPLCCLFFFDIQILITSLWYLLTLLPTDNHNLSHYLYKVRYQCYISIRKCSPL
jgi:hypothetical protein